MAVEGWWESCDEEEVEVEGVRGEVIGCGWDEGDGWWKSGGGGVPKAAEALMSM